MRVLLFVLGVASAAAAACTAENVVSGEPRETAPAAAGVTIGVEGGEVRADDVTLAIPAGALSAPVTITIRRSDEGTPAGIDAVSAVYRFEPDGLAFSAPVRVRIARRPGASASVYWTMPERPSTFERLESADDGAAVTASITHFSGGFAGTPRVEDADSPDAGTDAAASDAIASDGGAGVTCTFTRRHVAVTGCETCVLPAEDTVTVTSVPVAIVSYSGGGCWSGTGPWTRALKIDAPGVIAKLDGYTGVHALSGAPPAETFGGAASCLMLRYSVGGTITVANGHDATVDVTVSRLPGITNCGVIAGCVRDTITCKGAAYAP